jgi:hypothetical protein
MAEKPPKFDPYGILEALERHRVKYVLIGGFARVLQGTEELTRGVDVVPSTRSDNLRRLDRALRDIGAQRADGQGLDPFETGMVDQSPPIELATDHGELKIVPTPEGTRGFDDLRRGAHRENLGHGVLTHVASIGDLARMATALGTERHLAQVAQLRRLTALERGRSRVIER